MATITKKELIDRIAESSNSRRVLVKKVVQQFLDEIVNELGRGNRLEFRDFGVFETKLRKARKAQNPKTLEPVAVPEKRTVKFKVGRLMKQRLGEMTGAAIDDEAGDVDEMVEAAGEHDDNEGAEPDANAAQGGAGTGAAIDDEAGDVAEMTDRDEDDNEEAAEATNGGQGQGGS